MSKYKYIYILIAFIIPGNITAQNSSLTQTQQAMQILHDRGEIVIKFNISSKSLIDERLTHILSIDYVKTLNGGLGYEVRAYANQHEFQQFLAENIPYVIIPKVQAKALTMAATVAEMANWDRYPTYSVYEQMMANFASNYPALCDIDTILSATPSGNYKILVAKISDNVNSAENEPQFLYSSSIHGDETTGYYLMLRLINYLLTNYGAVPQVTSLVNGAEIWICPLANPEGTYRFSSPPGSSVALSVRSNLSGVDLNRNYPDPVDGPHPDGNSWAPETQAFMAFAESHHFNMGANFHGGAELLNYPWDAWTTSGNPNADAAWWERVCSAYVATARTVNSTYLSDTYADGVTEGGDWYTISGGRQDYMNYFKQCRELTIELDADKTTNTENLNTKWNENYASLLNYIQESLYGVRGAITDSCSGQPIRSKVWVNNYDQANDSSQVYSALPLGNYHKYMNSGTYSITFSAPGYTSKTINNVVLVNGSATWVNVALAPAAAPDAQFTGTITDNCTGTVQFTNTSTAASSFVWFFGDGATSTLANPTHTYTANGTYTVKLRAINCKGQDSLVRTAYIVISMAPVPTATGASQCGPGSLELTASGSGTINWYDAPSGGNLLYSGNIFTTPVITNTTTYYVSNTVTMPFEYVGKTDSSGGGAMYNNTSYWLLFDCSSPVILKSVKVYASTAGNRTIEIRNSSGAALSPAQTATINIPAGESRVNLNFNVPTGTSMSLRCTSSPNMFRNSGGITFPYDLSGKIKITGTNASTPRYYFFYDWEIETPEGCESPLVPVTANIFEYPVAGFTYTYTADTLSVSFTDTSANADSFFWDFGDGATSTSQHPGHTYPAYGTYTVMLAASNGGCSDTVYREIILMPAGMAEAAVFDDINIYPNPAQNIITIVPGLLFETTVRADIISMTGMMVYSKELAHLNQQFDLDISHLSKGVYTLRLSSAGHSRYFRLLKID
ncbi:MAG TPA: M14 family zinc carboxypeptidase [Bacteroidales bacterium]|nr:M14 family zinc carboxypeptidase [Bacteroidales bacterium]